MSNHLIRSAFETTLKTWADAQIPAIPIAFENVTFTPPATRYLRAFLLPADTGSRDLEGRHREYLGVYQISIVLPIGNGAGPGETLVAALEALFPMTAPLTSGGLQVFITSPLSASKAPQDPDRYVIPCSLTYSVNTFT